MLAVCAALQPPPGVLACIGAAGALTAPEAAAALGKRLLHSLAAAAVAVASDAVTSHAGALSGGAGVVLAAGTGAVAVAAGPAGFVRVDGYGPWLGDDGSGAAIGLAGLRAVLRAADGRGPATALTAEAARCYGVPPDSLPAAIGNTPGTAREAARFAPHVVAAAAAGDPAAGSILDHAATHLADTVHAAAARSGLPAPIPLALTGGVLNTGTAFTARLHAALARTTPHRIVPAHGTALDGARLLAAIRTTVHEAQVVRHPAP